SDDDCDVGRKVSEEPHTVLFHLPLEVVHARGGGSVDGEGDGNPEAGVYYIGLEADRISAPGCVIGRVLRSESDAIPFAPRFRADVVPGHIYVEALTGLDRGWHRL